MARMYSGRKGKSGSTKPAIKQLPSWVSRSEKEVEALVVKMAKEGMNNSMIGLHLRDAYGIPDVKIVTKKSIGKIIQEKGLSKAFPDDLQALIKKAVMVRKHLETNKLDQPAKRGLQLTESKIKRLAKYYKRTGKLDPMWKFDAEKAAMFVE